jgi:REP-associated tyrosine transposase
MGNHYHLVIETPVPTLGQGMKWLNGCYAQRFNRRWNRVGHLFQGRYKAILVEKDGYLLELVRYVVLNPVRAGWRQRPDDWRWSSYRALAGLDASPSWLTNDWVLRRFASHRGHAQGRVRRFVQDGIGNRESLPVRGDLYLGSDDFVARWAGPGTPIPEIPRAQWQPVRPTLESLLRESSDPLHAARRHGYTLREIGELTGHHYSTISRRLRRSRLQAA